MLVKLFLIGAETITIKMLPCHKSLLINILKTKDINNLKHPQCYDFCIDITAHVNLMFSKLFFDIINQILVLNLILVQLKKK